MTDIPHLTMKQKVLLDLRQRYDRWKSTAAACRMLSEGNRLEWLIKKVEAMEDEWQPIEMLKLGGDEEENKMDEFIDKYKGQSIKDLGEAFVQLKNKLEEKKREQAQIQKEFDHLRKKIIPDAMDDTGIDTVKLTNIGRISLRPEIYAGIVSGKKEEAYCWLAENGHEDLIQPNVNPSTLKAFLKEQMKAGEQFPEELFKAEPYMMATITKS